MPGPIFKAKEQTPTILGKYPTITGALGLLANQEDQTANQVQRVIDASGDTTVTTGYAYYEYLGTLDGALTDYRKLSEQESMDLTAFTKADAWAGKLSAPAYPNTRDDGPNPTNKIIGTDASGNLKSYSMAGYPAPYLEELSPSTFLPGSFGTFIIHGSFFTPETIVTVEGHAVTSSLYIDDNTIRITMTTAAAGGFYNLSINNGTSITFSNRLYVVDGTIFDMVAPSYENITGDVDLLDNGDLLLTHSGSNGNATIIRELDITKDFEFLWSWDVSPYQNISSNYHMIQFVDSVTNAVIFSLGQYGIGNKRITWPGGASAYSGWPWLTYGKGNQERIRYSNGVIGLYANEQFYRTIPQLTAQIVNPLKVKIHCKTLDTFNVKYIELTPPPPVQSSNPR
jgi:hypothetical protein